MVAPTHHIETIATIRRLAGLPATQHPLISLVDLGEVGTLPVAFPQRMTYGFYVIGCKTGLDGTVGYGRTQYDFSDGTLGFSRPHQLIEFGPDTAAAASGWLIYVHPDFLHGHPVQQKITDYGFFDYGTDEALHLSAEEESTLNGIVVNLEAEYRLPIDRFSREVMLSNLELLLSYADRFYHRQFLTRYQSDDVIFRRFTRELTDYFTSGTARLRGLPTVALLAERLHLSPGYLSDLLRAVTGKSTQEHIHLALIERGKNLLTGGANVSETATELGFSYPQYFSRLFKSRTGQSPREWTENINN